MSESPPAGDRARRGPGRPVGAQTGSGSGREALLRAARELMAQRGLPRVTVREVAERAGVQPGLANYYFGGKQGLLRAVTALVAGETSDRIQRAAASEGGPEERLRQLVAAIVEAFAADPYAPRLLFEQVFFAEPDVVDTFTEQIALPNVRALDQLFGEGRAAGVFREVEPMFLVPSLVGLCVFFFLAQPIFQRVFEIEEVTPELARRYAEHVGELLLHGITAREEAGA